MKQSTRLTIASLLSILFLSLHLADDIVRGIEKGNLANLTAVPIMVIWLSATLFLAGRRTGYVIILLGSLLGSVVPVIHFMRVGGVVGGRMASFPFSGNFSPSGRCSRSA
ncbi:MAG TPA: hypothetical protein VKG01_00845 [Thermoanaerobaculia bacterium]|nr:hypothetical protein [Thermoanaerobaculia bacterium]